MFRQFVHGQRELESQKVPEVPIVVTLFGGHLYVLYVRTALH
jgi:hypothetical protein